jgi:hypothetical protein
MRVTNLVEPQPSDGRGTPYAATEWLRRSVVPLTAAISWERKFIPQSTAQIGRLDIETAFLLVIPMTRLDPSVSGTCRLAVEVQSPTSTGFAGVLMTVEKGEVLSCTSRLAGDADAWATGSWKAWIQSLNGSSEDLLEYGGDNRLAREIVDALRATRPSLV